MFTYGSLTKYDTSYYLYLSQELQLGEFSLGISQQASKVQSINLNNFGLSVGLSLENFDIGILYNIGIKNVKQVFEATEQIRTQAKKIVAALYQGDSQKQLCAAVEQQLTYAELPNTMALKTIIADEVIAANGYCF